MDEKKDAEERKKLGILGGMGPEATGVLYDRITGHTIAEKDQDHLDIWIYSHAGLPDRTTCILRGEEERMREMLRADTEKMISLGCEYLAVPCNTCHYFGDEYSGPSGQPNCMQHEYDCDACDAVHEYWVEPVIVDAFLLSIC